MRRHWTIAAALVGTLVAGLLQTAPLAAARPPKKAKIDGSKTVEYIVKTRHGDIFAEAVHPTSNGKIVESPTVLTYSPYSALGRNGDADRWVPRGYTRMYADVVGTGNSGGCYDYGGKREKETGYDIVEWIADQKWSTGKVGMMGASYEGTTATATATQQPPHLTTIVPEAAISRWYEYAYSGGIRYTLNNEGMGKQGPGAVTDEGFDTPLAFDFGFAIPPPVDVQNPRWAERVQSTVTPCEELEHTLHGYDFETPDYDKFWLERDYIVDAKKISIPVLVSHNWGDWNVKQEEAWNLFHALKRSRNKVLFMGTRWEGHGRPGGDYEKTVDAWMDQYLMGKDTGVGGLPSVISQTSDSEGAGKFLAGRPNTRNVSLIAQKVPPTQQGGYSWQMLPQSPVPISFGENVAQFPSAGINTESHAAHHARLNHDWFWFETPPLRKDTRLFGEIKVKVFSTVYRKWVTVTPSIFDVDPADHLMAGGQHIGATDPSALVAVTRGFLDSRYRGGLDKAKDIKPGRPFSANVVTKPQDYVFKKGHYIGLNIQTEILEWAQSKPYPGCEDQNQQCAFFEVEWQDGKTRLVLPIVNAPRNPMKLFDLGHHH
ncbi:MAG: CocE/NonD family hydrolase [Actinomycetota bacterium]